MLPVLQVAPLDDLLIYPLALAMSGEKQCRDSTGQISLRKLAEQTGFQPTDAIISRGQICGRMFRYGELTYSCK